MSCPTPDRPVCHTSPPRNNSPQLLTAQYFTYNSFFMSGLRRIPAIPMKTGILGEGGGGVPNCPQFPFRDGGNSIAWAR